MLCSEDYRLADCGVRPTIASLEKTVVKLTQSESDDAASLLAIEDDIDQEVIRLCGLLPGDITIVDEVVESAENQAQQKQSIQRHSVAPIGTPSSVRKTVANQW